MNIRPIRDQVVVKPLEEAEITSGGIYIPQNVSKDRDITMKGTILAVSKGYHTESGKKVKLSVKVDDVVLFGKYPAKSVKIDNVEYMVMSEDNIFCVIE